MLPQKQVNRTITLVRVQKLGFDFECFFEEELDGVCMICNLAFAALIFERGSVGGSARGHLTQGSIPYFCQNSCYCF